MGIDPKIWGASAWALIHATAFNAKTQEDQRMAKHMYYSFLYILPCDKCRKNYDTHLVKLPVPDGVSNLARWSYTIHKRISSRNLTFQEAKNRWLNHKITVHEIVPFLESIANTHPSAMSIDSMYRDSLFYFIESLVYFVGVPPISKFDIVSRTSFKLWLKKVKRTYQVHSNLGINKTCNIACQAA